MRHYGKPLTSFVIRPPVRSNGRTYKMLVKTSVHCSGKGLSTLVSIVSHLLRRCSLHSPVSAAATINFAQCNPKLLMTANNRINYQVL